jgi:hypothetical protein
LNQINDSHHEPLVSSGAGAAREAVSAVLIATIHTHFRGAESPLNARTQTSSCTVSFEYQTAPAERGGIHATRLFDLNALSHAPDLQRRSSIPLRPLLNHELGIATGGYPFAFLATRPPRAEVKPVGCMAG